jgi:uncharacterized protein YcaQ
LFAPTTLPSALDRLGFVQIDPITAPACAQDLILRHRVSDYAKGDMDKAYPDLPMEEVFFINHGYLPRDFAATLLAGKPLSDSLKEHKTLVKKIQAFFKKNGATHPKLLNQHLGSKSMQNYWGGTGQEGTHLAQRMHSNGLLRISHREKGIRIYDLPMHAASHATQQVIVAQAIDKLAQTYAPFTLKSLTYMARLLGQSRPDLKPHIKHALTHIDDALNHTSIDGQTWYWPRGEDLNAFDFEPHAEQVRLLAPFDPLVWDRDRFALLWNWRYKFEAYKPAAARKLGYYALPILWRDDMIGWANVAIQNDVVQVELGYVGAKPREKIYRLALENDLSHLTSFLGFESWQFM